MFEKDASYDYVGADPYSKIHGETRISQTGVEFLLPRKKRGKSYTVQFDVTWPEVIAFDSSRVNCCKDDKTWPISETPPDGYDVIGPGGILFLFMRARGEAFFQVWSIVPEEDVDTVTGLVERYLQRPSLPGLAHHGTAAAVEYTLARCHNVERIRLKWHDWIKTGPSAKPRKKFQERDPDIVFADEGMAISFYGASPRLEQMSTFWPWRLIREVTVLDADVPELAFIWYEDSYTFRLQVWDEDERKRMLTCARDALERYRTASGTVQMRLIRPCSFPSVFHETWDDLQPFVSKASREGFPPAEENEGDP
ncbi:MAG: hypothetical protein QXS20_06390 [Candidatus Thorarchaeota archaeon]